MGNETYDILVAETKPLPTMISTKKDYDKFFKDHKITLSDMQMDLEGAMKAAIDDTQISIISFLVGFMRKYGQTIMTKTMMYAVQANNTDIIRAFGDDSETYFDSGMIDIAIDNCNARAIELMLEINGMTLDGRMMSRSSLQCKDLFNFFFKKYQMYLKPQALATIISRYKFKQNHLALMMNCIKNIEGDGNRIPMAILKVYENEEELPEIKKLLLSFPKIKQTAFEEGQSELIPDALLKIFLRGKKG